MSDLMRIEAEQIREAIAEKYHVSAQGVSLGNDYEFVRRGDDKARRDFVYAILDNRAAMPITNADRIRAMTDEELAEYLSGDEAYERTHWSMRHWLDWLKQEAEE